MVNIIKFFLFDDLNYRINYKSEEVDSKVVSAILNLFLSYFVKGVKVGILYKKIDDKFLILRVESEENNEYTINFVYIDKLSDYPMKVMYDSGFINSELKHSMYTDLEEDTLCKFVKDTDAYGLREIISSMFAASYYKSATQIKGNTRDLILYIAAIQNLFPSNLADDICFKIEEYGSGIGIATISIADNIIQIRDRFSLDSQIKFEPLYKFTSLMEMHYLVKSNNLEAFFTFLKDFEYSHLDERLEEIHSIYMMSKVGIGDMDFSSVKLSLDTIEEIGKKEAKRIVLLNMLKVIDKLSSEMDSGLFRVLMKFVFKSGSQIESLFISEMSKELYLKSIVSILFDGRYRDLDNFNNTIIEVEKLTDEKKLFKYMLDDKRLEYINLYLSTNTSKKKAIFILAMLYRYNISLGYKWNKLTLEFRKTIDLCVNTLCKSNIKMKEFFYVMMDDDEYLVETLLLIFEKIESESIQDVFIKEIAEFIMEIDDEKALEIRKRMSNSENGLRLMFQEFKALMNETSFDIESFRAYSVIFYSCKEYFKKGYNRALALMLTNLDENKKYEFAVYILNEINNKKVNTSYIPYNILSEIIVAFEMNVDFRNCEGVYELLDVINYIKRNHDIKTAANVTRLVEIQYLLENNKEVSLEDIADVSNSIYRLSENAYKSYKEINLNNLIHLCKNKEHHKILCDMFRDSDEFTYEYTNICLNSENIKNEIGLSYIIYYLYYLHPAYNFTHRESILENLREIIVERLSFLNGGAISDLDKDVKREFEKENLSMPIEWKEIYDDARKIKSDNSFIGKIKNIIKK